MIELIMMILWLTVVGVVPIIVVAFVMLEVVEFISTPRRKVAKF